MKNRPFHFDVFTFDPETLELFRAGEPVHLQRQPALVLLTLLERAGELVTRRDLQTRIWGEDRNVDIDRSVAYCLRQVRAALGDDATSARYVETLRGVGYRFIGRVSMTPPPAHVGRPRTVGLAGIAGGVVSIVAIVALIALVVPTAGVRFPAPTSTSLPHVDQGTIVRRADAYLRGRHVDSKVALTMYERVLKESPAHVGALAGAARATATLALHHRDLRLGQAALRYANLALQASPHDPGALAARAQALQAGGHLEDASQAYAAALRTSQEPRLIDDYGLLLYQRGRIDEAVEVLVNRWRTTEPDAAPAEMIATALGALGFAHESRGWSDLALTLAPDTGQAKYLEGLKAFRAGRLDEARTWIAPLLLERDPGTLVVALASQMDVSERGPAAALPRLIAAVNATPDAYEIRATLASVYHATGQVEQARVEHARAIDTCRTGASMAPQSPMWPRCLASLLAGAGSIEEAAGWYDRAVDLGWRKPLVDRTDHSLGLLAASPTFIAARTRATLDLERMRANVERAGVPVPPTVR